MSWQATPSNDRTERSASALSEIATAADGDEVTVVVAAVRPWVLEVELDGGGRGFIDNIKDPDWESAEVPAAVVGQSFRAVVIDDQRDPVRLSAFVVDLRITWNKKDALS
ncbi:hypothetical protein JNUCC0626_32330 [Lentzea sp. JNUCC 0626]|uniref:hypothetical protein n=1 Tax=Lentzea sp. JNUCC 0626 TaxID=3367513 RepID=UPI00374802AC